MEELGVPVTFEILRYNSHALYSLQCVNKHLKSRLETHLDYLQTLIQEVFGKDCRPFTYSECTGFLKTMLSAPTRVVCLPTDRQFLIFDIVSNETFKYEHAEETWLPCLHSGTAMCFISTSKIMFCGGSFGSSADTTYSTACSVDLMSGKVSPLEDMILGRAAHGIAKVWNNVYIFGGSCPVNTSAEVYSTELNLWSNISPLGAALITTTCAAFHNYVFIGGNNC